MVKFVVLLLASVLMITVVKAVVGIVLKGFADAMRSHTQQQGAPQTGPQQPPTPIAGELKRDPVCGTYVSTSTSIKKSASGQIVYFCSTDCRDKFKT